MRLIKLVMAIIVFGWAAFAVTQMLPKSVAADTATIADAVKVYPMTYRLTDLPVWSQDGKTFDPTILMAYIKTSVDTNAWGKSSTMAPFASKSSLVISTTSANHDLILTALERLRASMVQSGEE
ncbi:hypothetical protein [Rhodopirellula sallentina]|uniref:hypothetical protein n=1 Tax=Rhodopirellula sallentina TaxID=1263869 RepID=UPI0005C7C5AA|nr:hypothetical protein [Rhodopirellula sallentina]